jgi:hypothetical protein
MSSASEVSSSINDSHDRSEPIEIHHCVRDTLASLNVEGVEFFVQLDGGTLKVTLQTKKFLEAQDLAIELGKTIEKIAAEDILELVVYKRKSAETNTFLIKEMALRKSEIPAAEAEIAETPIPIPYTQRPLSQSSTVEYRPKLRMYGMLNSYL